MTETAKTVFKLHVNGKSVTIAPDDPDMPLLYALRNDLGLHGPRFGCGLGQCGACTVHLDGVATRSCVTPLSAIGNAKIVPYLANQYFELYDGGRGLPPTGTLNHL